jgi:hypothetical protein
MRRLDGCRCRQENIPRRDSLLAIRIDESKPGIRLLPRRLRPTDCNRERFEEAACVIVRISGDDRDIDSDGVRLGDHAGVGSGERTA